MRGVNSTEMSPLPFEAHCLAVQSVFLHHFYSLDTLVMNYYLFHFLSFSFLLLFLDPLNTINAGKPFEPTSTVNCEVRHLKRYIF